MQFPEKIPGNYWEPVYSIICQTMRFEYIAKNPTESEVSRLVPGARLEPARY